MSLVRVVIICPASTHTALVSSPSLAVLHLTTYLPTYLGLLGRCIVGKSRHRAHTESQREESGESQFQGSLWRATLSREAWMPIWGLSTESMKPWPPPGGGRGYGTKRRRWCGGTGVPGGHDTHRPFTNRKAAPGEGTVIRHVLGAPFRFWRLGRLRAPSTSLPLGA